MARHWITRVLGSFALHSPTQRPINRTPTNTYWFWPEPRDHVEMAMAMPLPLPRSGAATPNCPQSPLRITHDGEFYARLLTKESSLANPSFRYYGAGPGAVPFGWESHPGTPKDSDSCRTMSAAVLPAITPPPSYHLRAAAAPHGHGRKGRKGKGASAGGGRSKYCCGYRKLMWIKIGFIAAVFRQIALGKSRVSSSADTSSAASVQSSSTRWLFSCGSSRRMEDEIGGAQQQYYHYYDYEAPATNGMLCVDRRGPAEPVDAAVLRGRRQEGGRRLAVGAGQVHAVPVHMAS